MPKCPKCNENLPKKQRFCGYCGTDVTTGEAPSDLFSNLNKKNDDQELSYWARHKTEPIKAPEKNPALDEEFKDLPYVPDETEIEMRKSGLWNQFDEKEKKDNKKPIFTKPEPPEPHRMKSEDLLADFTPEPPPPSLPPSSTAKKLSPTPPPNYKPTINIPSAAIPTPKTAPTVNIPGSHTAPPPKPAAPTINPLFNNAPSTEPIKPAAPTPPPAPSPAPATETPTTNKKLSKFDLFESFAPMSKKKNAEIKPEVPAVNNPAAPPPVSPPKKEPAFSIPTIADLQKPERPEKPVVKIAPAEPIKEPAPPENNLIKVPDFTGQSKDNAKATLTRLGLTPILKTANSDSVLKGEIVSQSIAGGKEIEPGTEVTIVVSVGNWSKWTKDPYLSDNKHEIESQTIFRSREREMTIDHKQSDKSTMEGYTLYDSKKEYSNWETDNYYSKDSRPPSDTCEILKIMTGFKYYGWTYRGIDSIPNVYSSLEMAIYLNPQTTKDNWEYIETIDKTNAAPENKIWSPDNDIIKTPAGDEVESNISFKSFYVGGIEYAAKLGSFDTVWTKYRKRHLISVIYMFKAEKFTPWSEWSDWTLETDVKADSTHEVESQTLYRRRKKADE